MRTREFGETGITASEVGFGLWTISTGWWGEHSDEDAIRLLREAYDLGITLFDTADTYGEGRGETLLARALGHVRDRVTIATKFGYDIYSPWERKGHVERPHDWSPEYIRYALDQSLARLAHRPHRRLPAAQPAHGRDPLGRRLRRARRGRDRREDPHVWRRTRAGHRLARRGHRGVPHPRPGRRPDHPQPARAGSRPRADRGRAGGVDRPHDPRAPLLGDARGPVHEGHGVRPERPPPPPAQGVADRGAAEGEISSGS